MKTVSSHTSCSSSTSRSWGKRTKQLSFTLTSRVKMAQPEGTYYSLCTADQAWDEMGRCYISLSWCSGVTLTFWISGLRISLGPFSNLSMFIALRNRTGGKGGVEEIVMKKENGVLRINGRQIAQRVRRKNETCYRGFLILLVPFVLFQRLRRQRSAWGIYNLQSPVSCILLYLVIVYIQLVVNDSVCCSEHNAEDMNVQKQGTLFPT